MTTTAGSTAGSTTAATTGWAVVPAPADDARGVLDAERLLSEVRFERFAPSAALAPIVDWFWVVEWDRGESGPYLQYTIPHPVVNVVLAPEYARAYGVMRRRFARLLAGRGRAVAAKFRPGGFRELLGGPLSAITERDLPAAQVLGDAVTGLHRAIHRPDGPLPTPAAVAALDALLLERAGGAPAEHPVTPIAELAAADSGITRVEHLADRTGWSPRQLQRRFADAVGVGPKWLIRRHRLLEAAERARVDVAPDWARVAHDLGFSDQAHLVRSFTELVGVSPARYAREGVAGGAAARG